MLPFLLACCLVLGSCGSPNELFDDGGGIIAPGSDDGDGLSNHTIPVSNGTGLISSGETDDGTIFATSRKQVFGGGGEFSAETTITYNGITPTTTTYIAIEPNDTHTSGEEIPLMVFGGKKLAYDTTAGDATYWGIDSEQTVNHVAGANPLTATAYHCKMRISNALSGDRAYCLQGDAGGGAIHVSDGAYLGGLVIDGSGNMTARSGSTWDTAAATAVNLGENITATATSNRIAFLGDSTNTPQLSLGIAPTDDGTEIQTKNTASTESITGYEALLDTTINSGGRGGYLWFRGAGGAAGTTADEGGFVNVGASAWVCPGARANDGCLFANTGNLDFSTFNNSAGRVVAAITKIGGYFELGTGVAAQKQDFDPLHTPSVSNGTLSPDASNWIGRITGIGSHSSVTLTFGNSGFATTSHCHLTIASAPGNGVADVVYVSTVSGAAPTFSCIAAATDTPANCPDIEYECVGN